MFPLSGELCCVWKYTCWGFFPFKDTNGHWPPRLSHAVCDAKKSYLICDLNVCDVCVRAVRLVKRRCQTSFAFALRRRGNVMGKHLLRSWMAKCSEGGLEVHQAFPKESGEEGEAVLCSNTPLCGSSEWQGHQGLPRSLSKQQKVCAIITQLSSASFGLWSPCPQTCQEQSTVSTVSRKHCNKPQQDDQ